MKSIHQAAAILAAAGGLAITGVASAQNPPRPSPSDIVRADSGRPAYTAADVRFMQGMIHHHAQAVVMAQWAPSHGAGTAVQALAERIDVAQRDEISFMKRWLKERHEQAPDPLASSSDAREMKEMTAMHHDMPGVDMPGVDMPVMMPGMLTPEQMKQLDAARGAEFDRLFLTFMTQHHQGALKMVDDLFAAPGAAQEGQVFRFASDVTA
ncbi:MAG TPA: DUF305 domain-containing protein, partial [Gemmatimonadaceae bacterium]|nr:DUF305 domain-containing protein [Gemmatimonadaceae bacterium]